MKHYTIHSKRLKEIRPYIDFNFDLRKPLTPYQKRKIKNIYDQIKPFLTSVNQVYRPRKKHRLKKAQNIIMGKEIPGLKVAFIPTGTEKKRIKFDSHDNLIAEGDYIKMRFIKIDKAAFAADPGGYTAKVIENDSGSAFSIVVTSGMFEGTKASSKRAFVDYVSRTAMKYQEMENWLIGFNAYSYKNQRKFRDYFGAKHPLKNQRKSRKRKNSYAEAKGRE